MFIDIRNVIKDEHSNNDYTKSDTTARTKRTKITINNLKNTRWRKKDKRIGFVSYKCVYSLFICTFLVFIWLLGGAYLFFFWSDIFRAENQDKLISL